MSEASHTGKREKYAEVASTLRSFFSNYEVDLSGRYATVATALKMAFPTFWFCGFYTVKDADTLQIGPYQGDVLATGIIQFGRGVCGTAAKEGCTQIVDDVKECKNYIACDDDTKSEIVVPVKSSVTSELIAVLDIDSASLAAFDEVDKECLEALLSELF
jgi:GAF domain-containing protein